MFAMKCYEKHAEVDDYENGIPIDAKTCCYAMDITFRRKSIKECVEAACDFMGMAAPEPDGIFIDETNGDIVLDRMENDEGNDPTSSEYDEWKAGRERLWIATYRFEVKREENLSAEDIERELRGPAVIAADFPALPQGLSIPQLQATE